MLNTNMLFWCALVLASIFHTSSFGAEMTPDNGSVDDPEQLIEDLDHEAFSVREKATMRLFEVGRRILPRLREAANSTRARDHAEFRQRLRRVLAFSEGGEVDNGLRLSLEVDRTTVAPGENVTFTMRATNVSERPLLMESGYTATGHYFEGGKLFHTGIKAFDVVSYFKKPGLLCGNGGSTYTYLPPKSTRTYTCTGKLGRYPDFEIDEPDKKHFPAWTLTFETRIGLPRLQKKYQWARRIGTIDSKTIKLRIRHAASDHPWLSKRKPGETERWIGEAFSNEIALTVNDDVPKVEIEKQRRPKN